MTGDDAMVSAGLICFNTNLAAAVATVTAMIFTWMPLRQARRLHDVQRLRWPAWSPSPQAATSSTRSARPSSASSPACVVHLGGRVLRQGRQDRRPRRRHLGPRHVRRAGHASPSACLPPTAACSTAAASPSWASRRWASSAVAAWVLATMFMIFKVIDKTRRPARVGAGARSTASTMHEHGLPTAYAGFAISDPTYANLELVSRQRGLRPWRGRYRRRPSRGKVDAAVPVVEPFVHGGMHNIVVML